MSTKPLPHKPSTPYNFPPPDSAPIPSMDQADIPSLLSRLASDEDASRKMAVFKLQSSINDPSFADVFIASGGLIILRRLIMTTGGNTLAYALSSLSRLLEVDMGWDVFEGASAGDLVERVVELVVTVPLVNILRGAMSILVALVSHTQPGGSQSGVGGGQQVLYGFRALKPAVAVYPQFFENVIAQLQSADHQLCSNALMLVNALIRDAVSSAGDGKGNGDEWSKFIKRLQDLGLIKAVYNLMQSGSLQDLAHPLLEFQGLTRVLLRKWREVRVDLERPEHRRALKGLHLASAPDRYLPVAAPAVVRVQQEEEGVNGTAGPGSGSPVTGSKKGSKRHNPEKWRRLGFETESPAQEFDQAGFLGMMDLTDYVRKNEDGFQKLLLEQSSRPLSERCPVARASLTITMILYEHFEVDKSEMEDARGYALLDNGKPHDRLFRPLLLQWSRLHTAGLHAFFRMWKATEAEQDDFEKVAELIRILIEQVVGQATRTKDVLEVEDDLAEYDLARLRELQMRLLDLSFEDQWGTHLYQVREELKHEALQFVKEQRIRCLLQGSWFTKPVPDTRSASQPEQQKRRLYQPWRFARLSHNRRYLHYADFPSQLDHDPGLDSLSEKIDLGTISSVVSNVSAPTPGSPDPDTETTSFSSSTTARTNHAAKSTSTVKPSTKITIYSYTSSPPQPSTEAKEEPILTLFPLNHSLASEWLDGLLMLLNQAPITAETNKLVNMVSEYGLRIRLLNVKVDAVYNGPAVGDGQVPSREGLDEDYWYEV